MIALFRVFLVVFASFSISEQIKTCGRAHIMFLLALYVKQKTLKRVSFILKSIFLL